MSRKVKYVIFLLSSLILLSCSSQIISSYKNEKTGNIVERLNVNKLERQKNFETQTEKISVSSFANKFYKYDNFNKANNSSLVINKYSDSHGYIKCKSFYDYYFGVPCIMSDISVYDIHGILKYSGRCLNKIVSEEDYKKSTLEGVFMAEEGAIKIEIWNEYDSNGLVIKTINYDDGFEFNFKNLFDYMIKSNADIYIKDHFKRISIIKDYEKKVWIPRFNLKGTNTRVLVEIDAKTGNVIREGKSVQSPYY